MKDKDKAAQSLAVPRLSVCADAQKVDRAKLAQTEVSETSMPDAPRKRTGIPDSRAKSALSCKIAIFRAMYKRYVRIEDTYRKVMIFCIPLKLIRLFSSIRFLSGII